MSLLNFTLSKARRRSTAEAIANQLGHIEIKVPSRGIVKASGPGMTHAL